MNVWPGHNVFLAGSDFCRLLNSCKRFGPDQNRKNAGPDLDPTRIAAPYLDPKTFDNLIAFLKYFCFEKVNFEKKVI